MTHDFAEKPAQPRPFRRDHDPQTPGGQDDLVRIQRFLIEQGTHDSFRQLEKARTWTSLRYIFTSCILTGAAYALVAGVSPWFLPLALMVFATSQRSLGNNLHDAAHGNIHRRNQPRVLTWFLASALMENFERYRKQHLKHHAFLGIQGRDPDWLPLPKPEGERRLGGSSLGLYLDASLSLRGWLENLRGGLDRSMPWRERAKLLSFWLLLFAAISLAAGVPHAVGFVAVWFAARGTTYYALKVFTELSDHVGLQAGSILGYTRNAPRNLLSRFLHPHHDNYHLTHHLAPRVPMANLHLAHQALLACPDYAAAHHCDGYFFGRMPVVKHWVSAGNIVVPLPLPVEERSRAGTYENVNAAGGTK